MLLKYIKHTQTPNYLRFDIILVGLQDFSRSISCSNGIPYINKYNDTCLFSNRAFVTLTLGEYYLKS